MSFPKLSSPPTLTDTVAKRLLAEIQEGRVQPGDKLPTETALAEQFGVSRTVIREAVSRLRQTASSRRARAAAYSSPAPPATARCASTPPS